ncbi:multiprotein-bridging factor 1 family protein [Streptomyces sp. NPDC018031]|uniref:multiprotein-bridging factor 1 family protein n=1 Tax=Streptomyces sp. NPDC018031 TaxID=3365033 RepID=UPI0037A9D177
MGSGGDFGRRVAAALRERGWSLRAAARQLSYDHAYLSRVVSGKQAPSPQLAAALDALLDAEGTLVELAARLEDPGAAPDIAPLLSASAGSAYAQAIRETSARLVALDNEFSGMPIAEMSARAFKAVHRRLGEGDFDPQHERDIQAAAAELAEVAGWALFDAEKHAAARRFNQEALMLARVSGDRSIELLVLQNMAMHAGWLGRHREELSIARSVIERTRLSPRIEALFRMREAKGLTEGGQFTEGTRSFDMARSLHSEGERHGDPPWAWWVSANEIDGHQGYALQTAGHYAESIPHLRRALHRDGGPQVGYRNISAARLLHGLLRLRAWQEAEELALSLLPAVGETASVRTLNLFRASARQARTSTAAPVGVRDALDRLAAAAVEDPYTL